MKYPLYIDSGYFSGDMDDEYIDEKEMVKCRESHICVGHGEKCKKNILPGDHAVCQKAILPGEGRKSCYICTACIEEWLEESGQVENDG
jgi:hypothetical protein